jgi:hypothetical protein
MKSDSTWELNVEDCEGMGQRWCVVSIFVGYDGIVHTTEHRDNNTSNKEGSVKVLALLLRCDQIFISILLGEAENCVSEEVLFELKRVLSLNLFLPPGLHIIFNSIDHDLSFLSIYWNNGGLFPLNTGV